MATKGPRNKVTQMPVPLNKIATFLPSVRGGCSHSVIAVNRALVIGTFSITNTLKAPVYESVLQLAAVVNQS